MRKPINRKFPHRQSLYEQVWNKPLSHLAIDYDVKSWDIQTWCKQLHIPLPDRAYWSRQRHGLPVEQLPLPDFTADQQLLTSIKTKPAETPEPIHFPKETELSFKVPDRLKDPDAITLDAKAGLEVKRHDDYFVNTDDGQFPIRVAKTSVGRVLRILDTLIKCWKRRGYRIELHDRQAFIWLREVRQRVSIWEISKTEQRVRPGERKKMLPTGKLAIRMDWWGGRDWRDGNIPLEDQIQSILDHMERSARQLEREKQTQPKAAHTNVIIEEKKELEPEVQTQPSASQPPVPQASTPALPELTIPPAPITDLQFTPFQSLSADAHLWKQLKIVDEYLNAMYLVHPHTPEFLEWYRNAQALRKSNDPLIKKLTTG